MKKNILIYIITFLIVFQSSTFFVYGAEPSTSYPIYEGLRNGDSHFKNVSFSDIKNHWAKEAIQEVSSLYYMNGSKGKFYPQKSLNYGDAMEILIRSMGLEEEAQKKYPDNWTRGYYEVAGKMKIIDKVKKNEPLKPNPRQAAKREDVAYFIGRALKVQPVYGDDIVVARKFKDFNKINKEKLPYIEALLQRGYMGGINNNTFQPKGSITRAQMAQILCNANDDLVQNRNITKKEGQIIKKETILEHGKKVIYFTVENIDGTRNYLKYDKKGKNIFIVQNKRNLYYPDTLAEAHYVKYYINKNGEVIYLKIMPKMDFDFTGTVEYIDAEKGTMTVLDFSNKKHTVKVYSTTRIEVEGSRVPLEDLYYGQEVKVMLKGNDAGRVIGFLEEDPDRDGYIVPGTRFRAGDVLFIDKNTIEIKAKGKREKFKINPDETEVTKEGERGKLFQIKAGDKVLLTFDDIYSNEVSEIRVEDEERHIEGVFRGKIDLVDDRNKEVLIKDTYIYDEGKWKPYEEDRVKLKWIMGHIYEGGQEIQPSKLKKRIGEEVYIAFDGSYGTLNISKLLLKSGPSLGYNDKVKDVEYGTGKMVVDNNPLYFHPGTIVVKDNRLVDVLNIDASQDVFVYADLKNGKKTASFVSIEGTGILDDRIDGTRILVYRGKVEDIYDYGIKIGKLSYRMDHLLLHDNRWKEIDKPLKFTITDDTLIYDSELKETIPTKGFINSRYIDLKDIKNPTLRDRVKGDFYKNKAAYFVVKESEYDKEVLAINMTPHINEYRQNVKTIYSTIGEVADIDQDVETIKLTKVKNYNILNDRWENSGDETIDLTRGIVLINDVPIENDKIYLIKPKSKVYIIKNKTTSLDSGYVILIED